MIDVIITCYEDLKYILEVLEEKGYWWITGRTPTSPTSFEPICGGPYTRLCLCINFVAKVISYYYVGPKTSEKTGFNEAFDLI